VLQCTVLLEDKHVSSNAADRWQQFLHQQHVSIILPVDFSLMFNKNEADIIEFRYRNRDLNLTELLTVAQKTSDADVTLFGCHWRVDHIIL